MKNYRIISVMELKVKRWLKKRWNRLPHLVDDSKVPSEEKVDEETSLIPKKDIDEKINSVNEKSVVDVKRENISSAKLF